MPDSSPIELITIAMTRAADAGNMDTVNDLAKLMHDPDAVAEAIGMTPDAFVEWKPGKSAQGQPGWVSEHGQFRAAKPAGADANPNVPHESHVGDLLSGIADTPEVRANPGILGRVKQAASAAIGKAKILAYELAFRAPHIIGAWGDLFDHPDDMKKIGYNASFGRTDGHATGDPMKEAIGLPSHMVLGLVTKIGAAAVAFAKRKIAGQTKEQQQASHDEWAKLKYGEELYAKAQAHAKLGATNPSDNEEFWRKASKNKDTARKMADAADGAEEMAEFLVSMMKAVGEKFGPMQHPDVADVAKALRSLKADKAKGGAAQPADTFPGPDGGLRKFDGSQPPGPPPHPGLQWKAETHRWVNPHTKAEHEHAAWPDHEATAKLQAHIEGSDIPPHQKADYAAAAARSLSKMPKAALSRIAKHTTKAVFYADSKALGTALMERELANPKLNPETRAKVEATLVKVKAGTAVIGGGYSGRTGELHLDGGGAGDTGVFGAKRATTADIYTHELGHAIDGPDKQVSKHPAWLAVWNQEINHKSEPGKPAPLTDYAATSASEGFAEFARLVYGGTVPLEKVEAAFPATSKAFKQMGIWPQGA